MEHEEILSMIVQNNGTNTLYIHIYDLGSYWQIENILRAGYEVVPPCDIDKGILGKVRMKLKMTIPQAIINRGKRECNDIVKVIITDQPTSFVSLELPEIDHFTKTGLSQAASPAESLGNQAERGQGRITVKNSENWTALNFSIRTILI